MSNVLVKDRQTSELEYLNTAFIIRKEVTGMVMNEKIIPKKYRFVYAIPIIDKCRKLVDNGYVYDNCRNQTYSEADIDFLFLRKKEALMNMLDACKQILSELAAARSQYFFKINPYERVVGLLVDEQGLIKRELENITKKQANRTVSVS